MIFIVAITIGIVVVMACIIIATLLWYICMAYAICTVIYMVMRYIYIDYGKDYGMYGLYGITYGIDYIMVYMVHGIYHGTYGIDYGIMWYVYIWFMVMFTELLA